MTGTPDYGTPEGTPADTQSGSAPDAREADVVDLAAARERRPAPDTRLDSTPDGTADKRGEVVSGLVLASGELAPGPASARVSDDVSAPVSGSVSGSVSASVSGRVSGDFGAETEVLEGTVLDPARPGEVGPPELKQWAWTVGWRHKAHRLWVYKWRYLWNTFVVLGAWTVRACGWWFRGIARAASDFINYLDDRQALGVADQAAGGYDGKADVDVWLKARAERHREVKDRRAVVRSRILLPAAGVVLAVAVLLWLGHGNALRGNADRLLVLAWMGVGCWLVWYGRALTQPFLPQFREPSPYPPVTNDTVTGALLATRISEFKDLVKSGHSPVDVIVRDDAAGGKIAETHPVPGVTTEMIMAKSLVIAGALRRPPAMVHLSQAGTGVPGHVEILVLDIDPATTKPKKFAYLGKDVNVGSPCTIGYDPRNRHVRWPLPGANTIATGTPGSGKTAFLLNLGCLVASDITGAQLALFDFKGMGDYSALEPVSFAYCAEPDTTETARQLVAALRALQDREVPRRRRILTELKKDGSDLLDNDAAALTDRLARTAKYRMPWLLFIIDEVHEALSDPTHGGDIEQLLKELMKIGRACGIHFVLATQRTDADSIATSISSLPIVRVAFHQNGQPGNDQILGTGAYKRGIDATAFRRGSEGSAADDRGSCWFIGSEGGVPVKVRTTFVLPDVKKIVARALAARTKAGTLTGAAAGITEQPQTAPAFSALDDVRAVFIGDDSALHGDVIFARVETRHPGRWKTQAALIAALKAETKAFTWPTKAGQPTHDISRIRPADAPDEPGIEKTRKGIRLDHLTEAITHRDQKKS